jgi:hypothetical protein
VRRTVYSPAGKGAGWQLLQGPSPLSCQVRGYVSHPLWLHELPGVVLPQLCALQACSRAKHTLVCILLLLLLWGCIRQVHVRRALRC